MKKLRFLHIPKTAGTTFSQILNDQFANSREFKFSGDITLDCKKYFQLSESIQNEITLFSGHAPIYTGIKSIDNIATVTFLRNPIDRVKSYCQHVSEGKNPKMIEKFPSGKFDLDVFLNKGFVELNNMQTKMLVNTGGCAQRYQLPASEVVDKALDNLFNKLEAFGITEYFDESLILFQQKFNWSLPTYTIKNSKNMKRLIKFKSRHIERIRLLNRLDVELYERAKERFLNQINDDSFNKGKLGILRENNLLRSGFQKKQKSKIFKFINTLYKK